MTTEIALLEIDEESALSLYTKDKGLDAILDQIKAEVSRQMPSSEDMSKKKNRDAIASLAHKVARSKTYLDELGKKLTEDWAKKKKTVDSERKRVREALDALKEEVRKPLTDFENAEKARVQRHKDTIEALKLLPISETGEELELSEMKDRLARAKATQIDDSCEEFAGDYAKAKDGAITQLEAMIVAKEQWIKDQQELERLRAEEEARAQKERDERLLREAQERAQREAEEKAAREKMESDRRELELKLAAERAEREKQEAIRRAEEAEQRAKEKAEREAREAKEREEAERKAREADKAHKASINRQALEKFMEKGLTEEQGKDIIRWIASGDIPNVTINY